MGNGATALLPWMYARLGQCNGLAALGNALLPWRKGIAQEDTVRAVRATYKDSFFDFNVWHAELILERGSPFGL